MRLRAVIGCSASGIAWAPLAWWLGRHLGPSASAGVLAAPAIGLAVGFALGRPDQPRLARALLALYLAAALFALTAGAHDAFAGASDRSKPEVVLQWVLGVAWGVTMSGLFVLLWPLAYLNLWLLERFAGLGAPRERVPGAARGGDPQGPGG